MSRRFGTPNGSNSTTDETWGCGLIVIFLMIMLVLETSRPGQQRVTEKSYKHTDPRPIGERIGERAGKFAADFVPGAINGAAERTKERSK